MANENSTLVFEASTPEIEAEWAQKAQANPLGAAFLVGLMMDISEIRGTKGKVTRKVQTLLKSVTLDGSVKMADKVQLAQIQLKKDMDAQAARNAAKLAEKAEVARLAPKPEVDPIAAAEAKAARLVKQYNKTEALAKV